LPFVAVEGLCRWLRGVPGAQHRVRALLRSARGVCEVRRYRLRSVASAKGVGASRGGESEPERRGFPKNFSRYSSVRAGTAVKVGVPPYVADALAELFAERRSGKESEVFPDVARLLGRPATTFAAFAARYAAIFRGEAPSPRV
jgi:hypothetical protein